MVHRAILTRRPRVSTILLTLAALGLVGLIVSDLAPPRAIEATTTTIPVRRGSVAAQITGTGTVQPVKLLSVGFKVSGTLTELDVKVGDHVQAGQVLARVDPAPLQQALDQANRQLRQAQHQLDSAQQAASDQMAADQQKLAQDQNQYNLDGCLSTPQPPRCTVDTSLISNDKLQMTTNQHRAEANVTSAQDQVATAQAQVDSARQNLDAATLTAPMDGSVIAVNGSVGQPASGGGSAATTAPSGSQAGGSPGGGSPGGSAGGGGGGGGAAGASGLIVLADVSALQVVAPVAEADISRLQPNQVAQVTFDAVPDLTLTGHVASVAGTATSTQNVTNYNVTLSLASTDPRLRQGMTANATVTVASASDVLLVPNPAVRHLGPQTSSVLVKGDGKTQVTVPVTVGVEGDSMTEIKSGLQEGDRVLMPQRRSTTTNGPRAMGKG